MVRLDKLVERICRRPPEADFEDVRRVLEGHGWTKAREEGSHVTFTKPGEFPIVVPKVSGRTVKRTYLNEIIKRLGLEC